MKFQKLLAFILLVPMFLFQLKMAHADESKAQNYAVLLASARHVPGVMEMFEKMHKEPQRVKFKKAKIVLYGEAIFTMKKDSELAKKVTDLKKINVEMAVCANALKRLKVPQSDILPNVQIVESAYYEMIRLKSEGYLTLDL